MNTKREIQTTYVLLKIEHDKPIADLATVVDQRLSTLDGAVATKGKIVDGCDRITQLNTICGYVENGTSQTVRIFQDDATMDWVVRCGSGDVRDRHYSDRSLSKALDMAAEGEVETPTNG